MKSTDKNGSQPGETAADPDLIGGYIAAFPPAVQEKLRLLRRLVSEEAPEASEKISYAMPTFYLEGNMVHFAAFKNHIGFYPAPTGIEAFQAELAPYQKSKGAVQFPLDQPLPEALIRRMVQYRKAENLRRHSEKKTAKKAPKT